MSRVYSTVPIEVTRIGEHLNTISKTVARNPRIEEVTGSDFVVYLTYSYDEQDALGWVFSSEWGIYEGTQKDASSELMYNLGSKSFFGGATWYATEKEALEAQENYEAEIATPAPKASPEGSDANLKGKNEPTVNTRTSKRTFLDLIGRYF